MRVISTNIGEKRLVNWRGKQVATGIFKYPVDRPIYLGKTDVTDDHVIDRKYHGGIDKAVYLYSADHYPYWKKKYPDLDWTYGMFGENLTIEGLDEAQLHIGDIFKIGSALIQLSEPRQPCFKLGIRFGTQQVLKQFIHCSYSGAYFRVLKEGEVKTGDSIHLQDSADESIQLSKVYRLSYSRSKEDLPEIESLLNSKLISTDSRKNLEVVKKRLSQY